MEKRIWIATIPEIFGYGLTVLDVTEEAALRALKAKFYEWKKQLPSQSTFKSAFEDWGGRTEEIEIGKVYNDNFT
jgi:hypothetical protein